MARRKTLTAGVAALALAATAAALAPAANAQTRPASTANPKLSGALSRLARDPRDVSALLDAGQAALEMNDVDAAIGFYQRADAVVPGNAQVKAGLAGAYVRRIDPFTALPLFDEAARAGVLQASNLADRGLAYDLVGDTVSAQRYYRQALAAAPSDDITRRLALSQAIDGDRTGMEATLSPLLQRQDRAAWRTRAFALAILGKADEAESIARSTMSPDLALAMAAYLRYMPRLTRAQQAAAGNLGFFPRAADIGRDDPRVARYTRNTPELAAANTSLTPAGKPLGRKPKDDKKAPKDDRRPARDAELPALAATPPPEVRPTRETIVPAAATVALAPAPKPATTVTPPPPPASPPPAARLATVALPAASQPTYTLPPAAQPAVSQPSATVPAATQPAPKQLTLADAFADLAPPSAAAAPAPGAVDVTHITLPPAAAVPPKPKPEPAAASAAALKAKAEADKKAKADAAAKAKAEADKKAKLAADKKEKDAAAKKLKDNPARTWVQVAAGRDRKALAFDWRKMAKADPAVFKGKTPYVMTWGQTNRLMTGPFATAKAASAYIAELKKAGVSGAFPVSTDAGEVVDTLPGG